MSLNSVRVSWAKLLGNTRCADKIRIKHWKTNSPNQYDMGDNLGVSKTSYLIEGLDKYIEYTIQVIDILDNN